MLVEVATHTLDFLLEVIVLLVLDSPLSICHIRRQSKALLPTFEVRIGAVLRFSTSR